MVGRRQAKTNIARLQAGLEFRGEAVGPRQTYYVFAAKDCYFVLSFAAPGSTRTAGYFNIAETEAVEFVRKRFAGERNVSARDVVKRASRTKHVPGNLDALNILYVLVALGEASIAGVGPNRQLLFSVRKS